MPHQRRDDTAPASADDKACDVARLPRCVSVHRRSAHSAPRPTLHADGPSSLLLQRNQHSAAAPRTPRSLLGWPDPRATVVRRRRPRAHAIELAREGAPLNIIERQLGQANLGTTSIYLQGIDPERSSRPGRGKAGAARSSLPREPGKVSSEPEGASCDRSGSQTRGDQARIRDRTSSISSVTRSGASSMTKWPASGMVTSSASGMSLAKRSA